MVRKYSDKQTGISMKIVLFFCLAAFFTSGLYAQSVTEESTDSISIAYWNKVKQKLDHHKYREAFPLLDSLEEYAFSVNDVQYMAHSQEAKASLYIAFGQYDEAKVYFKNAFDIYLENEKYQAACLMLCGLSDIDRQRGDFDAAFEKLREAQKYVPLAPTNDALVATYNNIGLLFNQTGIQDSAYQYFKIVLDHLEPTDSTRLSNCHSNISSVFLGINNFQRAIEHIEKAIHYSDEKKAPITKNKNRIKKARLAIIVDDLIEAEQLTNKALAYFKKSQLSKYQIDAKSLLADIYTHQNRLEEARSLLLEIGNIEEENNLEFVSTYHLVNLKLSLLNASPSRLDEAYSKAKEVMDKIDHLPKKSRFLKLQSAYFEQKNRHKESKESLIKHHLLEDSLDNIERTFIVENLEIKYETEKKEKHIQQQELAIEKSNNTRNILMISLLSILLLSALFILFLRRENKIKSELQQKNLNLKEQEVENLKKENQLISMTSILEGQEEERKRIALDLHDNIGSMMMAIKVKMKNIQENLIAIDKMNVQAELDVMVTSVSSELRRISHNMMPVAFELTGIEGAIQDLVQQLEEKGIEVTNDLTNLDKFKEKQRTIMIFRVFQEIIQNVVKHANATKVNMESFVDAGQLHIYIHDNGKGIEMDDWQNASKLGLKSIQSRINYLGGAILYKFDKGTRFEINIPLDKIEK